MKGKTLLIVDDEVDLRDIVASEVDFMGGVSFRAENITAAREILSRENIDLIVSDIRMPGGTGIDLLASVKSKDVSHPPMILITGFADITVADAFHKGAEALINKPFNLDELVATCVRFTLPLKDRFKTDVPGDLKDLKVEFSGTMVETINRQEFKFGRGGAAFKFEGRGKNFDVGQPLRVAFKFADLNFHGVMVCRWIQQLEEAYLLKGGFEFLHLSDESLDYFLQGTSSITETPYIPRL